MVIQHNLRAMNALRSRGKAGAKSAKALERLSSGYRVNRAGDDAAGLAISEKMRISMTCLGRARENSEEGINLVKIAEGSMAELHDMLNRMTELADMSMNGTYEGMDREALDKEYQQLIQEINRIAESSSYSGIKLLDGSNRKLEPDIAMLLEKESSQAVKEAGQKAADSPKGSLLALNRLAAVVDVASQRSQAEVEALKAKAREAGVKSAAAKASSPAAPKAAAPREPTGAPTVTEDAANNKITISSDGVYDVSSVADGATIEIENGSNVKLVGSAGTTLENVSIVCKGDVDLHIENLNMESDQDISFIDFQGTGNTLNLIGTNKLESTATAVSLSDTSPVKAIIHAGGNTELSVFGDSGSLEVSNAIKTHTTDGNGGFSSEGAAIGGDGLETGGKITIYSGKIIARTDGTGAAIGGGRMSHCGEIRIVDGDIEVHAAGGAGIGSGNNVAHNAMEQSKYGGKIDILGGEIKAYADAGAGIGGGYSFQVDEINILGGNVYAEASQYGAGIGNGAGTSAKIKIAGTASVEAIALDKSYGAAIGGGDRASFHSIEISGNATVKAVSKGSGAAIGNGQIDTVSSSEKSGTITISENAIVTAENTYHGAAIGDGGTTTQTTSTSRYGYGAPAVNITGGAVTVKSGPSAVGAAIGGGCGCFMNDGGWNTWRPSSGNSLTISGGTVTVESGWIGGGADWHKNSPDGIIDYADDGTITVTGSGKLNYTDPRLNETRNPHPNKPTPPGPVDPDNPGAATPDKPGTDKPELPNIPGRGGLILHIGESGDDYDFMRVYIEDMHTDAMGISGTNVRTQASAAEALAACRSAINYVSSARADLGAYQNRLEHTINSLSVSEENITQSESLIRDADMADEILQYTNGNILSQTAQAMVSQANQQPQGVLQLLG